MITWEDLLVAILPLGVYEKIADDMADLYTVAVFAYPPARAEYQAISHPEIQKMARDYAETARNYDPHEGTHETLSFSYGFYRIIRDAMIAVIVLGIITSSSWWVASSRGLLSVLGELEGILVTTVLSGPTVLALLAGLVLLYVELLAFNTFVVTVLNQHLVFGMDDTATRDTDILIGYFLWNHSLCGNSGVKLLAVFSVLWILSAVPGWDPYHYVLNLVKENIGIFADADGLIDAAKRVFREIRSPEGESVN